MTPYPLPSSDPIYWPVSCFIFLTLIKNKLSSKLSQSACVNVYIGAKIVSGANIFRFQKKNFLDAGEKKNLQKNRGVEPRRSKVKKTIDENSECSSVDRACVTTASVFKVLWQPLQRSRVRLEAWCL